MWTWGKWVTSRLSNGFPAIRPCSQNFPILPYIYIVWFSEPFLVRSARNYLPHEFGPPWVVCFPERLKHPLHFFIILLPLNFFSLPVLHNCRNFYHQSTESALCILLYLCRVANILWKALPIMILTIYCNKALILHKLLWDCLLQSTLL